MWLSTTFGWAINFKRVNIAWQYDLHFEMKMNHRVVQSDDTLQIFIQASSDSLASWNYEFLLQDGYESEDHRVLESPQMDTLLHDTGRVMLRLTLPQTKENLLVVKFYQPENYYYYDISLRIGSLPFASIYPVDTNGYPILEKYINRSGYSWKGNDTFLAMQYADRSGPADPPMADMKALAPSIDMDTSFVFSDSVNFLENNFYVVRKDSLAHLGITMLRTPPYFPKYRQLNELIESMLYLTSDQEKKAMLRSKNPRQSFDSFWMNTYTTKSRARNAIGRYYNTVAITNKLFTDFKPGWKTDRGMVYIIYGMPDEVYRTENTEEWYYDDGYAFEFTIISSFFAPKTYTLRRNKEFEDQWYTRIAKIRRGDE